MDDCQVGSGEGKRRVLVIAGGIYEALNFVVLVS